MRFGGSGRRAVPCSLVPLRAHTCPFSLKQTGPPASANTHTLSFSFSISQRLSETKTGRDCPHWHMCDSYVYG
jgi:hypothetical protein